MCLCVHVMHGYVFTYDNCVHISMHIHSNVRAIQKGICETSTHNLRCGGWFNKQTHTHTHTHTHTQRSLSFFLFSFLGDFFLYFFLGWRFVCLFVDHHHHFAAHWVYVESPRALCAIRISCKHPNTTYLSQVVCPSLGPKLGEDPDTERARKQTDI